MTHVYCGFELAFCPFAAFDVWVKDVVALIQELHKICSALLISFGSRVTFRECFVLVWCTGGLHGWWLYVGVVGFGFANSTNLTEEFVPFEKAWLRS